QRPGRQRLAPVGAGPATGAGAIPVAAVRPGVGVLRAGRLPARPGPGDGNPGHAAPVHRRGVLPGGHGARGPVGHRRLQPDHLAGGGDTRLPAAWRLARPGTGRHLPAGGHRGLSVGTAGVRDPATRLRRPALMLHGPESILQRMNATSPAAAPMLLGELLLAREAIRPADLERALELQRSVGGRLGSLLVRIGAISEDQLLDALAQQSGLPVAGRDQPMPAPGEWVMPNGEGGPPFDWMQDREVLLWEDESGQAWCASRDPMAPGLAEALAYLLPGRDVRLALGPAQLLERTLDGLAQEHREASGDTSDVRHLRELAEEAPVVELVNNLMSQAVEQRASDIHLEPEESQFVVRFRIDGVLYPRLRLPRERFNAVASRLKLISGMDIAERRLPQDGRLSVRASGQAMDIRASALPGVHGESIVLRLLPKERKDLGLAQLGMAPD